MTALSEYLNDIIDTFINSSIVRIADSGHMGYNFYLTDNEISNATGRQRWSNDAIINHFSNFKISCKYDSAGKSYLIYLDLHSARLNAHQSDFLVREIARFKADHT